MKRVSVIGYGYSGRSFHTYLSSLADGLVLDSVVEPDDAKRKLAESERGVHTYSTVDEMISHGRTDLAVIATPHDTHAPLAIKLLSAGLNVVTDKAMCITTEEADSMIAAADKSGRLLSVFHNRRWDWDFNTLTQIRDQNLIGQLLHVEIAVTHGRPGGWRASLDKSGGMFYDWGSHLVDQALLLGASKPTKVFAQVRIREGYPEHGRLYIEFESGLTSSVEVGGGPGATIPKPHWYALGTTGSFIKYGVDPQEQAMRAGNIEAAVENPGERARVVTTKDGLSVDMQVGSVRTSWKSFYQNISDVLNGKTDCVAVDPRGVRNVISVLEAANKSALSGESVVPDIKML